MMSEIAIGIDLGTTNSEVAIVENGKVRVLADNEDKKMLPSVVGLTEKNVLLIGEAAKNQLLLYPERTISSVKRKMGTTELITLGSDTFTPQEISAMILKELKQRAENYLQQSVSKAVITVPAYFSEQQRKATQQAGTLAGLEVLRIINEPTAASLAYETNETHEKKIMVYDLGGGTFDVSIVTFSPEVVEVLSSCGNNQLGGDDFDHKIVQHLIQHLYEATKIDVSKQPKTMAKLKSIAEKAKIALSDHPYYQIDEPYLFANNEEPVHLSLELSREIYESMISGLIDETIEHVHQAVRDAKLLLTEIDEILLVGGSTRTPLVQQRLQSVFHKQSRGEIHPDLCVAMGAAIQAARLMGEKTATVLIDITPYTFGMEAIGELEGMPSFHKFVPIIQKNTPIPVTKSEKFYTAHPFQTVIECKIYQGENSDTRENNLIGEFKFKGLKKMAESNEITAQFSLDLNGILKVAAKEKKTGNSDSIVIDNVFDTGNPLIYEEASKRIEDLFGVGKTDFVLPASPQGSFEKLTQEANTLLAETETLIETDTLAEEDRIDLIGSIEVVRDNIKKQDYTGLTKAMNSLKELSFYLVEDV
jgi:molecular chaperone DnaK